MTKNIATVHQLSLRELVDRMNLIGYSLSNPETKVAHLFRQDGEEVFAPSSEALDTLRDEDGLLLWQDTSHSAYVCVSHGKPRIFFDGFTADEEQSLCKALSNLGILFTVAHEDIPFEA